jgi:hypothetical protein
VEVRDDQEGEQEAPAMNNVGQQGFAGGRSQETSIW